MEHKVKIVEVLERHKIHPKVNAHMNMHFCHMISKLVVRPPSRSMCLRWNMCSKWVIENATKFYMFLPQIGRVRRHLLQITSMSGTMIGRLWMHHLRRGWMWMKIYKGSMGECFVFGMVTIVYKHGCLLYLKFIHMTSLGTF